MKNIKLITANEVKSMMFGQDEKERYDFLRTFYPEYLTDTELNVELVKKVRMDGFDILEFKKTPENAHNAFEMSFEFQWNHIEKCHPEFVATLANIIARSEKVKLNRVDSMMLAVYTHNVMMNFITDMAKNKDDRKSVRVYLGSNRSLVTPYLMLFHYGISYFLDDEKYNFKTFDDIVTDEVIIRSIHTINGRKEVRNHMALASGKSDVIGIILTQGDMEESLEYMQYHLGEFDWNTVLAEVQNENDSNSKGE